MKSDNITILIPDGTADDLCLYVMLCLKKKIRAKIHVISKEKWNKVRFSRYCDEYHYFQASNDDEYVAKLKSITSKYEVTHIFPLAEEGIKLIQNHIAEFKDFILPPLPSVELINRTQDKCEFSSLLSKHHIEKPATILWENNNCNNFNWLATLDFPVLYKPALEVGGRGIHKFNTYNDLLNFLHGQKESKTRAVIQEYIEGYDIVCSVLCIEGQVIAYAIHRPIHLDNHGFSFPRSMQYIGNLEALDIVRSLMAKIQWNGVANFDLRYCTKRNKIYMIEMNPRYWGTLLGALSAGINFPYLAFQLAQGINVERPPYQHLYFYTMGQWLRYKLNRYPSELVGKISLNETDLKYFLADPLPKVYSKAAALHNGILTRINHKRGDFRKRL